MTKDDFISWLQSAMDMRQLSRDEIETVLARMECEGFSITHDGMTVIPPPPPHAALYDEAAKAKAEAIRRDGAPEEGTNVGPDLIEEIKAEPRAAQESAG